jgi:hypothetical protein
MEKPPEPAFVEMVSPGRQEIRHLVWKLSGNLHSHRYGPEVPKQWGVPPRETLLFVYMRDIFILNEIWTQDKKNIFW